MKMRKLLAGIAAAATLLGCAALGTASASADDTGATITIMNAQQGHTYKAYKVATFSNVKVSSDGETITSMDINTVENNDLKGALKNAIEGQDYANQTIPDEYAQNPMAFVATFNAATARNFANYFSEGTTGLPTAESNVTVQESTDGSTPPAEQTMNVPEGWYLVTDVKGDANFKTALVASTVAGKTSFKTDKTEEQNALTDTLGKFYAKAENTAVKPEKLIFTDATYTHAKQTDTVNIGDTLYYQVRTSVPKAASNREDYTIAFQDNAYAGLHIDLDSIKVCHAAKSGATGCADSTFTKQVTEDNPTRTLVTVTGVSAYVGHYVYLRYAATVTAEALNGEVGVLYNEARVNHNNNGWSAWSAAVQYTGNLKLYKYGIENGNDTKLGNVEFTVHRGKDAKSANNPDLTFTKVSDGVYWYDPASASTAVATNAGGLLTLCGLDDDTQDGLYTFVETKTAQGYADNFLPTFTVQMQLEPSSRGMRENPTVENPLTTDNNVLKLASSWTDSSDDTERVRVKNVKSITQLPLTGGAGIILFSVIAALLIAVAAVVTVKIRSVRRELQN